MGDEPLTIGAVAGRFGLTLRTLRFWEDKGLIAPTREGQARLYGPAQVARVGQIAAFSRAGVPLGEIAMLLTMSPAHRQADLAPRLAALRSQALAQIAAIDALSSSPTCEEASPAKGRKADRPSGLLARPAGAADAAGVEQPREAENG